MAASNEFVSLHEYLNDGGRRKVECAARIGSLRYKQKLADGECRCIANKLRRRQCKESPGNGGINSS